MNRNHFELRVTQFYAVLRELQTWLQSFAVVNILLPYGILLCYGGLVVGFAQRWLLWQYNIYTPFYSFLYTAGHFSFLLGFWLVLISREIRWAPYALLINAIVIVFPFEYFTLYTVIDAGMNIFFGYWLLRFTAAVGRK